MYITDDKELLALNLWMNLACFTLQDLCGGRNMHMVRRDCCDFLQPL